MKFLSDKATLLGTCGFQGRHNSGSGAQAMEKAQKLKVFKNTCNLSDRIGLVDTILLPQTTLKSDTYGGAIEF